LLKIFNDKYPYFNIPIEDLISQSNNSRNKDKVPRSQNSFILFRRNLFLLIKKFKNLYPDFKTTTPIEALISQSNNSLSLLNEFIIKSTIPIEVLISTIPIEAFISLSNNSLKLNDSQEATKL
ncbi:9625_t:CDS:1, partial [Ambispora gerdemannii]